MKPKEIDRIECAIRHIQTSVDVDPWAMEIAVEAMKEKISREQSEDGISRSAAIDVLRTCYDTETISMDNGDEYINYGDAVGGIEQLPPAQSERNIGRWIEEDNGWGDAFWRCSKCNAPYTMIDGLPSDHKYKFCPSCGAYMIKGGNDEVD